MLSYNSPKYCLNILFSNYSSDLNKTNTDKKGSIPNIINNI